MAKGNRNSQFRRGIMMPLSNINLYIWKPFSTSPPPPFTPAVKSAPHNLIQKTD